MNNRQHPLNGNGKVDDETDRARYAAAGRKRKACDVRLEKVAVMPDGESFVMMPEALLTSPAWLAMTFYTRRLIDFLVIEHLAHRGTENGRLVATYQQLQAFGIGRRYIAGAIRQAEALKLIVVERGGRLSSSENRASHYRLTWFASTSTETKQYLRAGDEWADTNEAEAAASLTKARRKPSKLYGARAAPVLH